MACRTAGKVRGARVSGRRLLLDGAPCSAATIRQVSAYVQQQDLLLPSATVREVVLTSAQLRLPYCIPMARKRALVEEVLADLDLLACADTLIGDELRGLKGVSGGERRRTSVAAELVKDPRLLFLDEPSSGLDSETAAGVVAALARLAGKGRTVVCTLHQPSSDMAEAFDDLLLLAGGRVLYGGPWAGAVDFFARAGFSCPAFKNPADHFLQVVTRRGAEANDTLAASYSACVASQWGDAWAYQPDGAPPPSASKRRTLWLNCTAGPSQNSLAASTTAGGGGAVAGILGSMLQRKSLGAAAAAVASEGEVEGAISLEIPEEGAEEQGLPSAVSDSPLGRSAACSPPIGQQKRVSASGAAAGPPAGTPTGAGSSDPPWRRFSRLSSSGLSWKEPAAGEGDGSCLGRLWDLGRRCCLGGGDPEAARQSALGIPLWYKVFILSQRRWRTWLRDPLYLTRELAQYVCFAVFVGLVYARFSDQLGVGDYARSTCVFVMLCTLSNVPPNTAVATWQEERGLLKRELGDRLYSVTAYYLARYSVLLPFALAQVGVFLSILYFMAGFAASVSGFFTFYGVLLMFEMVSEGIGACFAAMTRTLTAGLLAAMLCLMACLAFGGFLTTEVPPYFVWIHKASYFTYAYSALMHTELSRVVFVDPQTGGAVPGMQAFPRQLVTGLSYAGNVGVLAAQCAGMEAIKLASFHVAHWTDRL
ncbi:hypothetical protein HYH03_004359 [Edaphochlamys debaryana]|uniref:Uncharacterized protein n=1 Tax=Edaphochlamys debaryana TaxID=47281 RepID=A0A835YF35_9CHLO|nr:hypothetical protein HYH03_004359 [Edaphochlamys debaryana]|eukprot:KAG2497615.1 hypothetical protein HYH03_004359 [Edaphochlamys debaryana]